MITFKKNKIDESCANYLQKHGQQEILEEVKEKDPFVASKLSKLKAAKKKSSGESPAFAVNSFMMRKEEDVEMLTDKEQSDLYLEKAKAFDDELESYVKEYQDNIEL